MATFIFEAVTGSCVANLLLVRTGGKHWTETEQLFIRSVPSDSAWASVKCSPLAPLSRCHPAVPSWVLAGPNPPPWPQRSPAAHLSDSACLSLSSSCWCRWPLCSPPKGTRSRCTGTALSCVSGRTAPAPGCWASSPGSRSTWRWQVSLCCHVRRKLI